MKETTTVQVFQKDVAYATSCTLDPWPIRAVQGVGWLPGTTGEKRTSQEVSRCQLLSRRVRGAPMISRSHSRWSPETKASENEMNFKRLWKNFNSKNGMIGVLVKLIWYPLSPSTSLVAQSKPGGGEQVSNPYLYKLESLQEAIVCDRPSLPPRFAWGGHKDAHN